MLQVTIFHNWPNPEIVSNKSSLVKECWEILEHKLTLPDYIHIEALEVLQQKNLFYFV